MRKWKFAVAGVVFLVAALWFGRSFFEPLGGFDLNRNGVRDDLDSYIDKAAKTPRIRIAAQEVARTYQANILDPKCEVEPSLKAVYCLLKETQSVGHQGQDGMELLSEIQARMGNTLARQQALIKYAARFNGKVLPPSPERMDEIPCVYDK